MTRSQSKRLRASESTVCTRASWICWKVTKEARLWARASVSSAWASSAAASPSRSATRLSK